MRRTILVRALIGVALVAIIAWVANNTTWADVTVPMPPKGEALRNPFYAVQRFAETLGARTTWDRTLQLSPADAILVVADWHWSLSVSRREALKRWVESGGRLVVDQSLVDDNDFAAWSGITRQYRLDRLGEERASRNPPPPCQKFGQHERGDAALPPSETTYWLCDFDQYSFLMAKNGDPLWTLGDGSGAQAVRVRVGRGHVTAINATPFRRRQLFDGDHGWLFVTATELHRGDVVHFLSEADHPSLLALTWQYGAPVVVCAVGMLVLGLWRGSVRFGPLAPVPDGARRSLAEQIRGTGHFAARHEGGDALHAACVRALDEAAERRLPGYRRLTSRNRVESLAALTGFARDALDAAIHHPRLRRDRELTSTIALLESARRRVVERDAHAGPAAGSDSLHLSSVVHGTS